MSRLGQVWELNVDTAGIFPETDSNAVYVITAECEGGWTGLLVIVPLITEHLLGITVLLPNRWFERPDAVRLA